MPINIGTDNTPNQQNETFQGEDTGINTTTFGDEKQSFGNLTPEQQTGADALFKSNYSQTGNLSNSVADALNVYKENAPTPTPSTAVTKSPTFSTATQGVTTQPSTPVILSPATTNANNMPTTKPSWMEQADWDAIQKTNTQNVKSAYSSYNVAAGQYEQNKGYYANYDQVNNTYNNVLNSLQTLEAQNGGNPPTDQQINTIASQYNLDPENIKNPLNIFNSLQMTDEGKQKLGITNANQQISDYTTNYQNNIIDLQNKAAQTATDFQNQISDVKDSVAKNTTWMQAEGAWTGAGSSSGWTQAINNTEQTANTTISRLQTAAANASSQSATDISRLTQTYNEGLTQAKTELDNQLQTLNQNMGLSMTALTEQYGKGNSTLSDQLDTLMSGVQNKTADLYAKYTESIKNMSDAANTNIDSVSKLQDITTTAANQSYTDLTANKGVILQNTSLPTLSTMVQSGKLTTDQYNQLQSMMLSGIQTTLSAAGNISPQDEQTIEHLLSTGSTPAQIISKMQATGNYTTTDYTPVTLTQKDEDGTTHEIPASYDKTSGTYTIGGKELTTDQMGQLGIVAPTGTAGGTTTNATNINGFTVNMNIPRTGDNVGQDTNNPGNITASSNMTPQQIAQYGTSIGATGSYTSTNGRTYYVFPDMNTGLQASIKDIQNAQNGGSSWANPNMSLSEFIKGWTQGPNSKTPASSGYLSAVMKATGATENTPIGQINTTKLAQGIANGEGVDIMRGSTIPSQVSTAGSTQSSHTNELSQVASDLSDGKIKASDLKDLKYSPEDIKQIESIREQIDSTKSNTENTNSKAQLFSLYTSAPERLTGMGASTGQLTKNQYKQLLFDKGVSPDDFAGAESATKFLANTDATAFAHLNILKGLVNQLPEAGTTLTQDIVGKTLQFFGDGTQTNALMMGGLAGNEIAKFYGANGVSDRQEATNFFAGKTKGEMLDAIQQAEDAAQTKAYEANQKYSAVTGEDNGTFKQIMNTIKSGDTGDEGITNSSTNVTDKVNNFLASYKYNQ